MRKVDLHIPIYEWNVTVACIDGPQDERALEHELSRIDGEKSAVDIELQYVRNDFKNGGDTWRDTDNRQALIVIFKCTTQQQFIKAFNHEKRHLIDRIMEWANIHDTEAAAYLDGYFSHQVFDLTKEMML